MILYLTRKTFERYKLDPPENSLFPVKEITAAVKEREQGIGLLEWGGKLFYFDRRKCIQFSNFASKFTVFLFDAKVEKLPFLGEAIFMYLFDFYQGNKEMTKLLKRLADEAKAKGTRAGPLASVVFLAWCRWPGSNRHAIAGGGF